MPKVEVSGLPGHPPPLSDAVVNSFHTIKISIRDHKRPMANSKQVYNIARLLHFSLSSSLTFRNPHFYRVLGFITILSLQYLKHKNTTNAPNQTAVKILAVCFWEKAHEMVSLVRRKQLSN